MSEQYDQLLSRHHKQPHERPQTHQEQSAEADRPGEIHVPLIGDSPALASTSGALRNEQMFHLQRKVGNQQVQRLVQTQRSSAVATPRTPQGEPSWRATGNLRGNPPVRSENPPNKNVVEDEAVYSSRRATAEVMLKRQRLRAAALLDHQGKITDFRYFFSKVYSFVTENELKFAESRAYYYPSYVMASVLYFEQIFADNFEAFSSGARVEDHWRAAFEQMAQNYRMVEALQQEMMRPSPGVDPSGVAMAYLTSVVMGAVQSLVAGMQAHIRADLPRAEAWVFNSYYRQMPGVRLDDFRTDFMSMAGVFDNAGREMNADLAQRLRLPLDRIPQLIQDTSMRHFFDADMSTERADTWRRAQELSATGLAGRDPYRMGPRGLQGNVTSADHQSGLQQLPTSALRPSMSASAESPSDSAIRSRLNRMSETELAKTPALQRVQWIRRLFTGVTLNGDEDAILKILRASHPAGDFVNVVDGADAWDMMYSLDGTQAMRLRGMLRSHYYATTVNHTALRLIQKCMDGETAEWEELMVIDILEARQSADARALIQQLGVIYRRPGTSAEANYRSGLSVLEAQLDGEDLDRLHRTFGRSGR